MKNSILFLLFSICFYQVLEAQITSLSVETYYIDNGSIVGYPQGHKTFRIYANLTNSSDRVVGITGIAENPLVINVTGNGVWNTTMAGITGDDINCGVIEAFPVTGYDSFITIGVACDSDGSTFTTYTAEDPGATWLQQMFNTSNYGSIQDITVNTQVGAGWFVIPTSPASIPDANNKVLLAQITTDGTVCGIFNAQVFPEYTGPGSPYIIQNGLTFGNFNDNDSDGFTGCEGDCDDENADIFPGAIELCNGLDDNCDGEIDENLLTTFFRDFDGDGFGNPLNSQNACTQPFGYVSNQDDCDDQNAAINPIAAEICNYLDDNCNNTIDDGIAYSTFYIDADGDGFGDPSEPIELCEINPDVADNNLDCNDDNPNSNPNGTEICNGIDDDCNGIEDDGFILNTYYIDADGDGYGNPDEPVLACSTNDDIVDDNTDCDDTDPEINISAVEICDFSDNNCNGQTDEGVEPILYYADYDGDGYGSEEIGLYCDIPEFSSTIGGDCDDQNASINPAAIEICNATDDNCNFNTDEGLETFTFYFDGDGDGFGDPEITFIGCSQPSEYVVNGDDCNDANANIYPESIEICNGIDDDCDGNNDNDLPLFIYYIDADEDGFGDPLISIAACSPVLGYVDNSDDCNDANASISPVATEQCNDEDDNCNDIIDDDVVDLEYFTDQDNDGFGETSIGFFCLAPPNASLISGDCDDQNSSIYPGAPETCNSADDDCDNEIDELVGTTYYEDVDGDGFGNSENVVLACTQPDGFVSLSGDCDDDNENIHPEADEICNDLDDNCDGNADEGIEFNTYYADQDNDGFGNAENSVVSCSTINGYVLNGDDCNDNNSNINPSTAESCNDIDDDCDNEIDEAVVFVEYFVDLDNDGFGNAVLGSFCTAPENASTQSGDCNDSDANISPAADEICNNADDDCDEQIDEDIPTIAYFEDVDGDGYGNQLLGEFCSPPANAVTNDNDCDDTNNQINPMATEVCNEEDDNCDGAIDEFLGTLYYADSDGDGFGNPNESLLECEAPIGFVANDDDCDDSDATINPNAAEIPGNDVDENCDGQIVSAINEISLAILSIYPNPVMDNLILRTSGITGQVNISIIDALGKTVKVESQVLGNLFPIIDCQALAPGTYHITIQNENERATANFIKL